MHRHLPIFAAAAFALPCAAPSLAADDPAFANDLKATIVLNGKPCDQIVTVTRKGDSDYDASCRDGNRYHVFISPEGRVVVQKL